MVKKILYNIISFISFIISLAIIFLFILIYPIIYLLNMIFDRLASNYEIIIIDIFRRKKWQEHKYIIILII